MICTSSARMDLPDNNILIYALRPDTKYHRAAKEWLEESLNAGRPIRLFPTVEAGYLRVVTNPKIFSPPTPFAEATEFLRVLCACPSVEICQWKPSARERWSHLCQKLEIHGDDCNHAMLAAIALDRGLRIVTFDPRFKRFPGLPILLLEG